MFFFLILFSVVLCWLRVIQDDFDGGTDDNVILKEHN